MGEGAFTEPCGYYVGNSEKENSSLTARSPQPTQLGFGALLNMN